MQEAYHAVLGPSSAHRWRKCTASVKASRGFPNDGSDASRMGTACHELSAVCLQKGLDPRDFIGHKFLFCQDVFGKRFEHFAEDIDKTHLGLVVQHELEITDEFAEWVGAYIGFVRQQVELLGGTLLVEQRVRIEHITGEEGGAGTSDVIILVPQQKLIVVIDAKFGRNRVTAYEVIKPALPDPVTGEMQAPEYAPNDQLALYGGGALHEHELFHDFEQVTLIIVQPPLDHISQFSMPVATLNAHLDQVKRDAEATRTNPTYAAGDHCTYCPARVSCTARDAEVLHTALEGFTDVSDAAQIAQAIPRQFAGNMVGTLFMKLDVIRSWCTDIETRVFNTLNQGGEVISPDGSKFKLVEGRQGPRKWADVEEAEAVLKKMRLKHDEMYDYSLISPTSADKLAHPKAKRGQPDPTPLIGERQWTKLERLITRSDPKLQVVTDSDPRPAVSPAVDGFSEVSSTPDDSVDLF
jgi:hypothetical protein